jgi:hypothetical protein
MGRHILILVVCMASAFTCVTSCPGWETPAAEPQVAAVADEALLLQPLVQARF